MANSKSRSRCSALPYQSLQPRHLLAGDVQVIDDGNVLTVVGDGLANEIAVTQNESGRLVITGTDTTVNGDNTPFVASRNHRFLTMAMSGGDDLVSVQDVTLSDQITFRGGTGNDQLTFAGIDSRYLHIQGNEGNDTFDLAGQVRQSAYLYLGEGNDIVAIESMQIGRNFKTYGGEGDDTFVSSSLSVRRKLVFDMDSGDDDILMTGATSAGRKATIEMGDGSDFVSLRPDQTGGTLTFNRGTYVNLGSGDDVAEFGSQLNARRRVRIDGDSGNDAISQGNNGLSFRNFETTSSDVQQVIDRIFETLDSAGIDSRLYSGSITTDELEVQLTMQSSPLEFNEGDVPVSIDSSLTLTINSDVLVDGATVGIDEFQSGEDVLSFTDTDSITGAFDSNTGTLTLSGSASASDYETALRQVLFNNTSDDPSEVARTIQVGVRVGDESSTGSRTLVVTGVDVETGLRVTTSVNSRVASTDNLPVVIDDAIELFRPDGDSFNSATVSIATGLLTTEDRLIVSLEENSNLVSSYNSVTGVLTLSGTANVAEYQNALRSVAYENTAEVPSTEVRVIRFTITDGEDDSDSADIELSFTTPSAE